jgi:hypothetical protein
MLLEVLERNVPERTVPMHRFPVVLARDKSCAFTGHDLLPNLRLTVKVELQSVELAGLTGNEERRGIHTNRRSNPRWASAPTQGQHTRT